MLPRFAVSHDVLDAGAVSASLVGRDFSPGDFSPGDFSPGDGPEGPRHPVGAFIAFSGLVRGTNQGRQVLRLDYEGYDAMIVRVFARIAAEIDEHWPGASCAIHHRLGTLDVGDVSIVIATASAHRAAAYAASRYAIERVKQIAPIWKHEYFEGGDVWIEGAIAGEDDEAARKKALVTACA